MAYSNSLREMNDLQSDRFEAKVASESQSLRIDLRGEIAEGDQALRLEIARLRVELLKWMFFSFYVATMLGMAALIFAVAR